jgi:hypothetical protein
MAGTGTPGNRGTTGRGLPTDIAHFSSKKLTTEAKQLIVVLLDLIRIEHGTLVALIRHAMTAEDKPYWAAGDPDNETNVRTAKSTVSKFLGRSAVQPPDWPTVAWIVRACVADEHRARVLAQLAGLWCDATGIDWPPGYVGALSRDGDKQVITDPDDAPDDATRAQLYKERGDALAADLARAVVAQDELRRRLHEREQELLMLSDCLGTVGRRLTQLEQRDNHPPTVPPMSFEAYLALSRGEAPSNEVLSVKDRMDSLVLRATAAETRVRELVHFVAILVAHARVTAQLGHPRRGPGSASVVPVPGLGLDAELLSLLNPPVDPTASPTSRWLAVYLRTALVAEHGSEVRLAVPGEEAEVIDLVDHARLPSRAAMREITRLHPMLRAFGPVLLQAVLAERRVPLSEAPTVPRMGAVTGSRVRAARNAQVALGLTEDSVTVEELLKRYGQPPTPPPPPPPRLPRPVPSGYDLLSSYTHSGDGSSPAGYGPDPASYDFSRYGRPGPPPPRRHRRKEDEQPPGARE